MFLVRPGICWRLRLDEARFGDPQTWTNMRVLQISLGIYPVSQAGTEIYTAELARALIARGLDLHVAVPNTPNFEKSRSAGQTPAFARPIDVVSGSRIGRKLRTLTLRRPIWEHKLRLLIGELRPELIHVHHAAKFGMSLFTLIEQVRLPVVVTLPDYWLLCPGILRQCQGDRARCARECCGDIRLANRSPVAAAAYLAMRRRQLRRFVRRSRPVLAAISDSTRNTFAQEGFPAELLVTRKWGIDQAGLREQVARSGRPPGPPRISYIGSMRSHKGCHVLLEAFLRSKPNASLYFYGGGDADYVRSLRQQAGDADVQFHGAFDHASIPSILAASDIVVIPSVWEETYCLVAQEAMAARKPVIASNVGGMADRITHGVNGFLVEPDDPASLADQLKRAVEKLPELAARLDFDRCALSLDEDVDGWISIYQQAIAGHGQRN